MILGASIVFLVREQRRGGDDSNTEEATGAHGFAAAPACAREVISRTNSTNSLPAMILMAVRGQKDKQPALSLFVSLFCSWDAEGGWLPWLLAPSSFPWHHRTTAAAGECGNPNM